MENLGSRALVLSRQASGESGYAKSTTSRLRGTNTQNECRSKRVYADGFVCIDKPYPYIEVFDRLFHQLLRGLGNLQSKAVVENEVDALKALGDKLITMHTSLNSTEDGSASAGRSLDIFLAQHQLTAR